MVSVSGNLRKAQGGGGGEEIGRGWDSFLFPEI